MFFRKKIKEPDIFLGFSDEEVTKLVSDIKTPAQEIRNYSNTQLKNLRVIFSAWIENTKQLSYTFSMLTVISALITMLINAKISTWITTFLILLFCFFAFFTVKTISELIRRIKPVLYIQRLIDYELEKREIIKMRREKYLSKHQYK